MVGVPLWRRRVWLAVPVVGARAGVARCGCVVLRVAQNLCVAQNLLLRGRDRLLASVAMLTKYCLSELVEPSDTWLDVLASFRSS